MRAPETDKNQGDDYQGQDFHAVVRQLDPAHRPRATGGCDETVALPPGSVELPDRRRLKPLLAFFRNAQDDCTGSTLKHSHQRKA